MKHRHWQQWIEHLLSLSFPLPFLLLVIVVVPKLLCVVQSQSHSYPHHYFYVLLLYYLWDVRDAGGTRRCIIRPTRLVRHNQSSVRQNKLENATHQTTTTHQRYWLPLRYVYFQVRLSGHRWQWLHRSLRPVTIQSLIMSLPIRLVLWLIISILVGVLSQHAVDI